MGTYWTFHHCRNLINQSLAKLSCCRDIHITLFFRTLGFLGIGIVGPNTFCAKAYWESRNKLFQYVDIYRSHILSGEIFYILLLIYETQLWWSFRVCPCSLFENCSNRMISAFQEAHFRKESLIHVIKTAYRASVCHRHWPCHRHCPCHWQHGTKAELSNMNSFGKVRKVALNIPFFL